MAVQRRSSTNPCNARQEGVPIHVTRIAKGVGGGLQRLLIGGALLLALSGVQPQVALGQGSGAASGASKPGVVVDIDSPEAALYRIAVASFSHGAGTSSEASTGPAVIRKDLTLISLFDVLNPASFTGGGASRDGVDVVDASRWRNTGAHGVIHGDVQSSGSGLVVRASFFDVSKGTQPQLTRTYTGSKDKLRGWMHAFAAEVVKLLTGQSAPFGSRLVFAKRLGHANKGIFVADFDGEGQSRVGKSNGVSMLPDFGPGGIWYSRLTRTGMFITSTKAGNRPLVAGSMNMGATFCGGRMYFSSTRTGNGDIYSATPDGSDLRRLTDSPAIDVSPACGPGGRIAFVSGRSGGTHVFVMNGDGSGVKRITTRGTYNQTPSFCQDPKKPLIAFTSRQGNLDVFTVNLQTGEYTRLTQAQGDNKDPAFSPDCRMVAFASSRNGGGIVISSPEGLNQQMILRGKVETVRWSR